MLRDFWHSFSRRRLPAKIRRLFFSAGMMQDSLADLKKQLERMEDRICRIETGLEKADYLTPESRLAHRHLDFKSMTLPESFDYIYRNQMWGGRMYSGSGSYGEWAENFVRVARDLIADHRISSVADVGCGDFNVGRQLCGSVQRYLALDVSNEIISRNKEEFKDLPNVTFRQTNACVEPLPFADLIIIRQVLQHLTNAQIEAVLRNVERSGAPYVLIAEHSASPKKLGDRNVDLPSHGNFTRVDVDSGVFLDLPPFSRSCREIARFEADYGLLTVYLWEPKADSGKIESAAG